jgi:uncharacterized hydrophobic protein (TIGR00271 family)
MPVLALIKDQKSIDVVLPWASTFTTARDTSLVVVCWTQSAVSSEVIEDAGPVSQGLIEAVKDYFSRNKPGEVPKIIGLDGPNEAKSVIDAARENDINLIVAAGSDPSGKKGGTLATNPLLKQSPFTTVILFGGSKRSTRPQKVLVGATDNANDISSVFLSYQMAESLQTGVTLARPEFEAGLEGAEIGRRDLEQLKRDSGVHDRDDVQSQVFQSGEVEQAAQAMNENDLVMFGANYEHLAAFIELTDKPTFAVVKRQPPLRRWQAGTQQTSVWSTRLSPADYAELIQGLRQGSKLGADFVTMLSLATVVASLGLLQDSAAVVIGSMLLAPLMTPMIGCGLALAQANSKLGYMALKTVAVGLICTLVLSYLIGVFTPGEVLTSQIYARGQPTILDLFIAVASAAAASYALARPNLVGSIAGVAIATALVPPLCSVGISIAYSDFGNAQGAALLFATNFFAIVLAAGLTFRLIGISSKQAGKGQKFWVFRIVVIFGIAIIAIGFPLQKAMEESLVQAKPQPRGYPLAKSVMDAVEERLAANPGYELLTAGQPSSPFSTSDVMIVLSTTDVPEPGFVEGMEALIKEQMNDESLRVKIHLIKAVDEGKPAGD